MDNPEMIARLNAEIERSRSEVSALLDQAFRTCFSDPGIEDEADRIALRMIGRLEAIRAEYESPPP